MIDNIAQESCRLQPRCRAAVSQRESLREKTDGASNRTNLYLEFTRKTDGGLDQTATTLDILVHDVLTVGRNARYRELLAADSTPAMSYPEMAGLLFRG